MKESKSWLTQDQFMTKPMLGDGSVCLSSPKKWSTSRTSSMSAEVSMCSHRGVVPEGQEGLASTFLPTEASFQGNELLLWAGASALPSKDVA